MSSSPPPEIASYTLSNGIAPPNGWDYALEFTASPTPPTTPTPFDIARTLALQKLKSASFSFTQIWSPADSSVLVLLALPEPTIQEKAHFEGIKLPLKPRYGSGYLAFDLDRAHVFANDDRRAKGLPYFTPAQRVLITLNVLKAREAWGAGFNLNTMKRERHLKQAFALHTSPERDDLKKEAIFASWWWPVPRLPLSKLNDYFGSRVTLYLAWLSFYARMLFGMAALSVPMYIALNTSQSQDLEAWIRLFWALAVCFWGTYWLEYWKRRNAVLNVKWGLGDFYDDNENDIRAEFIGTDKEGFYCRGGFVHLSEMGMSGEDSNDMQRRRAPAAEIGAAQSGDAEVLVVGGKGDPDFTLLAPVTGLKFGDLPVHPFSSRLELRNRIWLSSFITFFFSIVVATLSVTILFYKNTIVKFFGAKAYAGSVPGVATALLIFVSDSSWRKGSSWLTKWENHRTTQSHENSLIIKRFAFQFVSNYVSLFYVALIKPFTPSDSCMLNPQTGVSDCMFELEALVTSLVITKATVQQLAEIGIPSISFRIKRWLQKRDQRHLEADLTLTERTQLLAAGATLDNAAMKKSLEQADMEPYKSTMEDYGEVVIQHGFLVLFGLAFPLAAVVNLINNMIETRTDTFKLLAVQQRPDADDAADIGTWVSILQFLSMASVMTTAALVTITTPALQRALPDVIGNVAEKYPAMSFLLFEHVLLMVRWAVAFLVKSKPSSAYRMIARQEFLVAKCFNVGWKSYYRNDDVIDRP